MNAPTTSESRTAWDQRTTGDKARRIREIYAEECAIRGLPVAETPAEFAASQLRAFMDSVEALAAAEGLTAGFGLAADVMAGAASASQ